MKKFRNLCKTKGAKILAVLFIAGLLVFSFAPGVIADGPIFNGLPGDKKLIRGANGTQNPGSTDWSDPVSGNSGDAVEVLVYYHNIVEGTTARNTRISVVLPSGEKKNQVLNAKLWAANADAINDTLTINSDKKVAVEYIPGSTVWYPNAQNNPGGQGQILPDGIITPAGVSLGGIEGCWQYAGFVAFQVRLMHTPTPTPTPTPTYPNIAIEKFVSSTSLGRGIYNWEKEIQISPNEEVAYRLSFNNSGDGIAQNVIVKDVLPAGLSFINGSGILYRYNGNTPIGAELFTDGVSIGTFGRGESAYIIFKAIMDGDTPSVCQKLTNLAVITAAGGLRAQDSAIVSICANVHARIEKSKSAWNISQNIDATKVPAQENNLIEYHLITKNTGNGVKANFVVEDDLSDVLDNARIVSIGNNGRMEGNTIVYPTVDLGPGQVIDYTFKVKVLPQVANSDLTMRNIYGNWVVIIIEKRPPVIQNPHLTIEKLVRNVSQNETSFVKENSARSGQIIEYKIVVRNDGQGEAFEVKLRDVLPIPVSYLAGSISITLPSGQVITPIELFKQDISLGNLKPSETITAVFRATVNSEIACGSRFENKVITTSGNLKANSFAYTNVVCQEKTPIVKTSQVKGISTLTPTGTPLEALAIVGLIMVVVGSAIIVYKYKI